MSQHNILPAVGIIPARWASARLPGKVLADVGGKPLIRHVWERCRHSELRRVLIATDSEEVACVAGDFGAEVVLTDACHINGTSRCLEAFEKCFSPNEFPLMINIQGDEPFIAPETINILIHFMSRTPEAQIGTAFHATEDKNRAASESLVKLVTNVQGRVMYFSRALIPHVRSDLKKSTVYKIHIGIYAFRTSFIHKLKSLPPSELEGLESLEQLRWLYEDLAVYAAEMPEAAFSVDTREDLERARMMYLHHKKNP